MREYLEALDSRRFRSSANVCKKAKKKATDRKFQEVLEALRLQCGCVLGLSLGAEEGIRGEATATRNDALAIRRHCCGPRVDHHQSSAWGRINQTLGIQIGRTRGRESIGAKSKTKTGDSPKHTGRMLLQEWSETFCTDRKRDVRNAAPLHYATVCVYVMGSVLICRCF